MKKGVCFVLLLITMFSCMKHEDVYNGEGESQKKKEEFDKNFPVKDIDPKQDWNMAKQIIVTVAVNYGGNGEYTIKMYSDNPRNPEVEAYLLGKYTVKDGSTNTLPVDVVSGSESVYVCCVDGANGTVLKWGTIENGKVNISFGATPQNRAVSGRDTEWKVFDVAPIADLVKPGTGIFQEGKTPQGANTLTSYEFTSNGRFTVYPVYGETDGNDEIGYYYYDPKQDIKDRKTGCLIKDLQVVGDPYLQTEAPKGDGWNSWFFQPYGGESNAAYLQGLKGQSIRSKACVINVPQGYRVGFYVKVGGNTFYSNKVLNGGRIHSAVVYDGKGNPQYIGLEDNPSIEGRDCNDIIFYIPDGSGNDTPPEVVDPDDPDNPIVKPEKPVTWTVACEDLGSTGDYDFNDVVFGVTYISGTKEATVVPYAAGGTLAASIYCGSSLVGEIHALLGVSSTSMINTYTKGSEGKPVSVKVNADFSMSSGMGAFSLVIEGNNEAITSPGQGEAPQMICVPGGWAWPTERTNIVAAYSGFGEWGANYHSNQGWWKTPTGSVIK